jgi:metallo-beta-lactamase family protein
MIGVPYHRPIAIAPGVELRFFDAGHVLGSAVVVLDVDEGSGPRRLVFTGDLGRKSMPILRDPECPEGADALLIESTYGDRVHGPTAEMGEKLGQVLRRVFDRGGKVVIPSFALERAQEVVFALKKLRGQGALPTMPVYVDSPLTVKLTDVFRLHAECLDDETRALMAHDASPFDFDELRYVSSQEDSKRIDAEPGPCVIISASGMCEAGRVLHHLRATIEDAKNAVMIVGFQAQHTLGRRLVERRAKAKIFGVERDVRAEIVVMDGFSAHADQKGLLAFVGDARRGGRLKNVVLVHGEPPAQRALAELLAQYDGLRVTAPRSGDRLAV